jgi:hypothetical protein
MKKIIILSTVFLSTIIYPSSSFGEWDKIGNSDGDVGFYVDTDRVRFKNDYVYWWSLINFPKPYNSFLSMKSYRQGDCNVYRFKDLTTSAFPKPMGTGNPSKSETYENPKWKYARQGSFDEIMLDKVCKEKR